MASNLLKTFEKIERGRQKCISKANEVNYPLPEDASLEQIANCIDAQGYVNEYYEDYKALLSNDVSNLENGMIRIPSDLTKIGRYAFYNKNQILGVILHDNITDIDDSAFYNTTIAHALNLPNSLKYIGTSAFRGTKFERINIPSSVTTIGTYAFDSYNGVIDYDGRVSNIAQYSFNGQCTELNFTDEAIDAITRIDQYAFRNQRNMNKSFIGKNVMYLGLYSFSSTVIPEHVVIPENCTMGNCVFNGSILKEGITLPSTLSGISEYMFNNAGVNQDTLTIPKSVASIGSNAFASIYKKMGEDNSYISLPRLIFLNEEKLTFMSNTLATARVDEMIIHASEIASNYNAAWNSQYIKNIVFINLKSGINIVGTNPFNTTGLAQGGLYIPDDLVDEYKAASKWSTYASYIKPLSSWPGYEEYMASLEVSN